MQSFHLSTSRSTNSARLFLQIWASIFLCFFQQPNHQEISPSSDVFFKPALHSCANSNKIGLMQNQIWQIWLDTAYCAKYRIFFILNRIYWNVGKNSVATREEEWGKMSVIERAELSAIPVYFSRRKSNTARSFSTVLHPDIGHGLPVFFSYHLENDPGRTGAKEPWGCSCIHSLPVVAMILISDLIHSLKQKQNKKNIYQTILYLVVNRARLAQLVG